MLNIVINDHQLVWPQWNGLTYNCHDQPQSALHDGEKYQPTLFIFQNSPLSWSEGWGNSKIITRRYLGWFLDSMGWKVQEVFGSFRLLSGGLGRLKNILWQISPFLVVAS